MAKVRLLVELNVKPAEVGVFQEMFRKEFISRSRAEDGCVAPILPTLPVLIRRMKSLFAF